MKIPLFVELREVSSMIPGKCWWVYVRGIGGMDSSLQSDEGSNPTYCSSGTSKQTNLTKIRTHFTYGQLFNQFKINSFEKEYTIHY
jgi:hypothetical protein